MIPTGMAVRPDPEVLERRVPDGFLLLGTRTNPILLAGTAAEFWDCLRRGPAFEDAVAELARRYQAGAADITADLEAVVRRLVDDGIATLGP